MTGVQTCALPISVTLLGGALVGVVNGTLIAKAKLPPFIATLGMLNVTRGLAQVLSDVKPIYFEKHPEFYDIFMGKPILGIPSQGMLCSARELDLGDDHSGILILGGDTPLGIPYGDALGLQRETVFDCDLTRNRPDCWGHLGVARDVAAKLGIAMHPAPAPLVATGPVRSEIGRAHV